MLNTIQNFQQFKIDLEEYFSSIILTTTGTMHTHTYVITNKITGVEEQKTFATDALAKQQLDARILEIANGREIIYLT